MGFKLKSGLAAMIFTLLIGPCAMAADGRIEINQAHIEANGGFPYTLATPGSYVLTGPLSVPAGTDGLVLGTQNISIDLNGFTISSTFVCSPGNCTASTGEAIKPAGSFEANQVTVRNGSIIAFASHCIRLRERAHVTDMKIFVCGRSGIRAEEGSVIMRNTVSNTGLEGLFLTDDTVYADNTVSLAGLGEGDMPSVAGGTPTGGNFCDDDHCGTVDTRKLFYMTQTHHAGNEALNACAPGFHMASMWELTDISHLRYDTNRGFTTGDSGQGPPTGIALGWVRTGFFSGASENVPGQPSCNAWTSNTQGDFGTLAILDSVWGDPATDISPWIGEVRGCNLDWQVWCVQD